MATLDKDLLKDFLLDITTPKQVCDLVELMKENNLTEEAKLLIQTVKENGFNKNDTIYVDNILDCYTQETYMYDCDGDRDYFESHGDGTYSFSYTDISLGLGLDLTIDSDGRAQDLYIPCGDDEFIYIGIILDN